MKQKTHYDCGWNDTVTGLLDCKSGAVTLAYIKNVRDAAKANNCDYNQGVVECVDKSLADGYVPARREGKEVD